MPTPDAKVNLPLSDLQLPGEPNRGYALPQAYEDASYVETDESRHVSRPFVEVFPYMQPGYDGSSDHLLAQSAESTLLHELDRGAVIIDHAIFGGPSTTTYPTGSLEVTYPLTIDRQTYDTARKAGTITEGFTEEKVSSMSYRDAERAGFTGLIDESGTRGAIETAVRGNGAHLLRHYDAKALFEDLEPDEVAALKDVSEMFALEEDEGRKIDVLNASEWKLPKELLRGLVNAIRAVADVDHSGGRLFDRIDNILIVPETHPSLYREQYYDDGSPAILQGRHRRRTLILSDRYLKPESQRLALPETYDDGSGRPLMARSGDDQHEFEELVYHEATHAALEGNDLEVLYYDSTRGEPEHVQYGAHVISEGIAETATGDHVGGKHAETIGPKHRSAMTLLWALSRMDDKNRRASIESFRSGGKMDNMPLGKHGPGYVVCRAVSLDDPEHFALGPVRGRTRLALNPQYRFSDDQEPPVAPSMR